VPLKIECVTIFPSKVFLRGNSLPYRVCLMRREDIAQVTEIDREAFPTLWPPTDYQRELQNRLAHYTVAYDVDKTVEVPDAKVTSEKGFPRLVARLRGLFGGDRLSSEAVPTSRRQYIVGFAGFWMMAEEAHIINLAVRQAYRRLGIGELLLISLIELATEMKAHLITLEVRASNIAAQSLYSKYGFTGRGLRRAYYSDDREDAVIMSLEDNNSASFQARLNQLKQAHFRKWGISLYQIAR